MYYPLCVSHLFQPTENIVLFLTVLTGSLLLQSEDYITLRTSLAALLIAAKKFDGVFKSNTYQMIVPTLVQVHSIHRNNRMITDAIEFIWVHFYWIHQNSFLLQAVSSIANLFCPETSMLAHFFGINYSPVNFGEQPDEQSQLKRSTMQLMVALGSESWSELPKDELDILVIFSSIRHIFIHIT